MTTVCFDIETTGKIEDCRGRNRKEKVSNLNPSVICFLTLDSDLLMDPVGNARSIFDTCKRTIVWPHLDTNWTTTLLTAFDNADVILGYNSIAFDHALLRKYYDSDDRFFSHVSKAHDVFSRVRDVTDRWIKLDDLLRQNGISVKSGDGLKAISLWKDQKLHELGCYCLDDCTKLLELALLPRISIPAPGPPGGTSFMLPHVVHGVSPAVSAARQAASVLGRLKRVREQNEEDSNVEEEDEQNEEDSNVEEEDSNVEEGQGVPVHGDGPK